MKTALVECAWAAVHCKKEGKDYLRSKYYSLVTRVGYKKALIAIGHKILQAAWHMIKNEQPFTPPDPLLLQQRAKAKQLDSYMKKIKQLGYEIILQQ